MQSEPPGAILGRSEESCSNMFPHSPFTYPLKRKATALQIHPLAAVLYSRHVQQAAYRILCEGVLLLSRDIRNTLCSLVLTWFLRHRIFVGLFFVVIISSCYI